ncbi:hypothetical protein BU15DRAFT_78325 [Melanogaster broomeanus]|nr:hypothetical protein BU15DRAFT_78325 [Melanogaster broomeanus]
MAALFIRQFAALFWKNWIVLYKHKFANLVSCLFAPIGFGVFLALAPSFLSKPNNYGMGTPAPVYNFTTQYDGSLALIWSDATTGTGSPSANAIMARITSGFNQNQLRGIKQVASPSDIPSSCPQNFNLHSECYAAIAFNYLPTSPTDTTPINYTISADGGLNDINVYSHTSDFETRILPLQLAIDDAIINLRSGQSIPTPLEWPYTKETNEQQSTNTRLSYVRGIRTLAVLALFICYIGIAYQLPGAFSGERANLLTSHMKAMGLLDSARIISWHVSMSLACLPAWITVAVTWHYYIFSETNIGLVLVIHLLLGFSLASWSFFIAVPFGKSPQLAAIASTFMAFILAILALVSHASTGVATIFTLVFPPGFYIFAIRTMCGWENNLIPTNVPQARSRQQHHAAPYSDSVHMLLERRMRKIELSPHPSGAAISIRNLCKTFSSSMFRREKGPVTAIADLSIDIPKFGIFVLLGSNGAGKSTSLSIVANLLSRTSGSVTFEGGVTRPPRGTLGIVPQKNVLFPDLTCYQTLRVWHAVKCSSRSAPDEDCEQLLRDCDLGKKIHSNANTLSGGQKRKLQLAIGLIGGSSIVLVDEMHIWRGSSVAPTIVFTTHFLDEADLLADNIAILATPGKLVAEGSPVALKKNLGQGYTVQVSFDFTYPSEVDIANPSLEVLDRIRELAPQCALTQPSPMHAAYHLKSKDSVVVQEVLKLLDDEGNQYHIASYDVSGTSIEDIFLDLMHGETRDGTPDSGEKSIHSPPGASGPTVADFAQPLSIPPRALVARRSWLTPVLTVLTAVCGACVPLFYLSDQTPSCTDAFENQTVDSLYLPDSPVAFTSLGSSSGVLTSPPDITSSILGQTNMNLLTDNISDNATFVSTIQRDYLNIPLGGISIDIQTGNSLIAWEANPPGLAGLTLMNLATNTLYNLALNVSGDVGGTPSIIMANYASFPEISTASLEGLNWISFFGTAMSVFPAFFSLYVSRERRSAVQAMQLSNGLSNPIGLWLGHLLWDSMFSVTIATIIIIIFAIVGSNQFYGLGFFWVVLVLYGVVGALFAYCVSLFMKSPLSSFAVVAGYQIVMYSLYLTGYLLTLTYAQTSQANQIITIIHFTVSILSPVASVIRSALVSVNLFSLLCNGTTPVTTASMGDILRYGGPILYLFVYGFVLFGILVWVDSGSVIPRRSLKTREQEAHFDEDKATNELSRQDVARETRAVAESNDALRVLHVTKSFDGNRVVDNVSFGVSRDTIFAMIGPNGAGKTTTFGMIRGDIVPDTGDVKIKGTSVVNSPHSARLSLGVCPQFTAIDSQLTVREHLLIYGRLKGLRRGDELNTNIESLMVATSLNTYADRLASQLSGGNQRKLSLAIALLGNPSVVLIDEFSTGIDAKIKREMWGTLRNVAVGKAVVITTHSMEEASALANKVGIISKKMLAVGTTDSLAARYASYQVHLSCRTREDVTRAQVLMSRIPGARLADDVATRFEVPIQEGSDLTLARLFHILSSQGDFQEYAVEKATLENVFLKVIRENSVLEEDNTPRRGRFRLW